MTTIITSPNWRGERAAPVDPAGIRFKAQVGHDCDGCMFAGQSYKVCNRATEIAIENGQPDCDQITQSGHTYIYVIDKSDPRQMDMLKEVTA